MTKNWEKEFDKVFKNSLKWENDWGKLKPNIKQFIKDLMLTTLDELKEEEETYSGGMERFEEMAQVDLEKLVFAYNVAIKEINQKIETIKKRYNNP